ncbi:MAG: DUF4403 family protein [Acidobacteria bacterium]|nr:DUF4403 family protein [Acidobacteriota bacterium]MBV9070647.1 DUF4403 family protein [Acidobacteriota bacterium]MBV9478166.1 DUF4403 family protein [Acidobacteriota bacterium]
MFPLTVLLAGRLAAQAPAAAPAELSTIAVPIRANLAPLVPEIEARVPKTFSDKTTERGIDIEYTVARAPLRLQMIGGGLHASTTVKYGLQACRGRFPCISCGWAEARREAEVTLHAKFDWDPAWRLRSTTRLLPVNYAKPCETNWLGFDITPRFVAPVVEEQLNLAAKTIDRTTPSLTSIRPQAQQMWNALQTPVALADRVWLVLDPIDVALGPITGSGTIVTSTLSMRAQTRVVVGPQPTPARKPLPTLRVATGKTPTGIRVPFDLELSYDDATRLASSEVAGQKYNVNGRPLTIESIKLSPAPNNRVAVEAMIDYRGGVLRNYHGAVFLEGTPQFDAASSTITVPDLEYSLDPKRRGFLVRIAERAAHDTIRQRMRESARFPVGPRIAATRNEITRALTRPLAPNVQLRGHADAIEPQRVTATPTAIVVHIIATGVAEVELRP